MLPDLFMLGLDYPDISPATLVENLEEFADEDDADIYLSDIAHLRDVLDAYVKLATPVVEQLKEARRREEEEEEGEE